MAGERDPELRRRFAGRIEIQAIHLARSRVHITEAFAGGAHKLSAMTYVAQGYRLGPGALAAIGDDDTVYFGDNAGTIHAIDNRGNAKWTARVESPVRSAFTIPAPHRLAVGQDDDTLVVLECSSTALAPEGWPKLGRTLSSVA